VDISYFIGFRGKRIEIKNQMNLFKRNGIIVAISSLQLVVSKEWGKSYSQVE
jgi:hypothetical protein